jgi:PAS domain-containing protein
MSNQTKDKTIEQLKLALDAVPCYVYIKDINLHYIYANKITRDLFGLSEQEVAGKKRL